MDETILAVKVAGDFACFIRPDLKVERMTYPCMTPSAARGILDCILWKPEFRWYVCRILDCETACDARGDLNDQLMTSSHLRPPVDEGVRPLVAFYAEQEAQEATHA